MSGRTRLTQIPICGRVVDWKGAYGWIEPQCKIDHPDITNHQGHIFAHSEDVIPKWKNLTVGSLTEFHLYYDGQGLGAEDCVTRKVLRLTIPWETAQQVFGEAGERIPEFERRFQVTMRAYQWVLIDGSASGLPFILFEVWGSPRSIVPAVIAITSDGEKCIAQMLVPESRLWKIDLQTLRHRCACTELSQDATLTDPMRCHSLSFEGARDECSRALHALVTQICD